MNKDASSGEEAIRFVRWEDMPAELAEHIRQQIEEHATETEQQWMTAAARLGPLRFGFADQPLPDGAAAAVIRDPAGDPRRMLVFSENLVTGRVVSIARLALLEDEKEVPAPEGRRVLLVWEDQRVRHGPGPTKQKTYHPGAPPRGMVDDMRRLRRSAPIEVPEIGSVRLLEPNP